MSHDRSSTSPTAPSVGRLPLKPPVTTPDSRPITWAYGFGPGDVRIVVESDGQRRWTFRDLQDRVVREYLEQSDAWSHERDFIHAPNGLIATRRHNGAVRYFHADHLGTPRLYTAEDGALFSRHDYYPFGTEIEDTNPILTDDFESGDLRYWLESKHEPRVEYTGHERDANGLTDYMMARTYLYPFFRFGSLDPARDGWNPYTYVRNNPVAYVDPEGEKPRAALILTGYPEITRDISYHSALMIYDDDPAVEMEPKVYSHGGRASGAQSLDNYLAVYNNDYPTVQYDLELTTAQVTGLELVLEESVNPNSNGEVRSIDERYEELGNNCAAYCANKISAATGQNYGFFRPKLTIHFVKWLIRIGLIDENNETVLAPGPSDEKEKP